MILKHTIRNTGLWKIVAFGLLLAGVAYAAFLDPKSYSGMVHAVGQAGALLR